MRCYGFRELHCVSTVSSLQKESIEFTIWVLSDMNSSFPQCLQRKLESSMASWKVAILSFRSVLFTRWFEKLARCEYRWDLLHRMRWGLLHRVRWGVDSDTDTSPPTLRTFFSLLTLRAWSISRLLFYFSGVDKRCSFYLWKLFCTYLLTLTLVFSCLFPVLIKSVICIFWKLFRSFVCGSCLAPIFLSLNFVNFHRLVGVDNRCSLYHWKLFHKSVCLKAIAYFFFFTKLSNFLHIAKRW